MSLELRSLRKLDSLPPCFRHRFEQLIFAQFQVQEEVEVILPAVARENIGLALFRWLQIPDLCEQCPRSGAKSLREAASRSPVTARAYDAPCGQPCGADPP